MKGDAVYRSKRIVCAWMFREGLGYKRAAALLGLPPSVVRDYGRKWRRGNLRFCGGIVGAPRSNDLVRFALRAVSSPNKSIDTICAEIGIPKKNVLIFARPDDAVAADLSTYAPPEAL